MDTTNSQIIEQALKENTQEITFSYMAKLANYTEEEQKWARVFWDSAFNRNWLYLSNEMIHSMGYEGIDGVTKFNKRMRDNYEVNVDYKEVERYSLFVASQTDLISDDKNTTFGNRKKFYMVSGEAFKLMLMSCRTEKGKQIRKYFIKTEQLAIIMRDYMTELLKRKLVEKDNNIAIKDAEITESKAYINRLATYNAELLSYKKFICKEQSLYVISSEYYARNGLFKIGRTKRIIQRRAGEHNTSHSSGDEMKVLKEFKVSDAVVVENTIKSKLKGLIPTEKREFVMCPYNLLIDIIGLIVHYDDQENYAINSLIDNVCAMRFKRTVSEIDWTEGLDMSIFENTLRLVGTDNEIVARFDISTSTKEQKELFIEKCLEAYLETIQQPREDAQTVILWSAFQCYVIKELGIPRYKFKSGEWKGVAEEVTEEKGVLVEWRARKTIV